MFEKGIACNMINGYTVFNGKGKARTDTRRDEMATATKTENDGRQWFELNGVDYGTEYEFDGSVYGVTDDNVILDADGCTITEGDVETIAVRNTIEK